MRAVSQEIPQPLTTHLKFILNLPGANELMSKSCDPKLLLPLVSEAMYQNNAVEVYVVLGFSFLFNLLACWKCGSDLTHWPLGNLNYILDM